MSGKHKAYEPHFIDVLLMMNAVIMACYGIAFSVEPTFLFPKRISAGFVDLPVGGQFALSMAGSAFFCMALASFTAIFGRHPVPTSFVISLASYHGCAAINALRPEFKEFTGGQRQNIAGIHVILAGLFCSYLLGSADLPDPKIDHMDLDKDKDQ
eukprot:gnl/TRDRNA2_/TRDRNA2_83145_c0_seq1.p1 gnl/TRDRNA2_/TRDRNA2_83145_c0~~gnl/TRDRNA2_/TRDRNA2_83145_c0_seq1.p1  ORF type:complete len:155 (-),score=17.43 gnl/TRDRNA2_/TRDRNA2_83145_c0_seq1:116-580(-)